MSRTSVQLNAMISKDQGSTRSSINQIEVRTLQFEATKRRGEEI